MPLPHFDFDQIDENVSFECLEEGNEVADLIGLQLKLRHRRMTSDDALSQGFIKGFDGIQVVQGPKRRGGLERAGTELVDRVTTRAVS